MTKETRYFVEGIQDAMDLIELSMSSPLVFDSESSEDPESESGDVAEE
jgi:hypothetical protein